MQKHFTVPDFLNHLKLDHRGYPVPYFVAYVDGKPDFRLLDAQKQSTCIDKQLCAICGKKLHDKSFYFIGGPLTLHNRISTDTAMHRECGEFSLRSCPHLYFEKADRRPTDIPRNSFQQELQSLDKPTEFFLIRARKYRRIKHMGTDYVKFDPISSERFIYANGIITKS